jgi:signal transduction histidine kinase
MATERYSLRWHLILLISIPILIAGIAIGTLAFFSSWHEIEEVYDAQLIHSAKVLRQLAGHELKEHELNEKDPNHIELIPQHPDLGYKYEKNIAFRIWKDGRFVTGSQNASAFGISDLEAPPGLSDQIVANEKWRFFVFVDPTTGITTETSQRYEIRYELIEYLMLGLLLPAGLFIPAVLLLVWYGTSKSLRPLQQLSADMDQRHSEDMSNIEPDRIPDEVKPLLSALNRLLGRLEDSFQRERQFTDNAAHELRTPLAAIKTQAQALQKNSNHHSEYREGFSNLLVSIDRAAHMVDQLLAFSRLQTKDMEFIDMDLSELVRRNVQDLAPFAVNKNHDLTVDYDDHVVINGNQEALAILVRNLVDNAIKYTPRGGVISAKLCMKSSSPVFSVSDSGPGIDDVEKERVLDRFYRTNKSSSFGSGLGLSIVKWIADQHFATVSLTDEQPTGLRCTVTFKHVVGQV